MLILLWQLAFQPPDSLAALRSAQRAQEAFESRRGFLAPRTLDGRPDTCDENIGRFCYWYGDDRVPLPSEPDEIKRARSHLIDLLDSAAVQIPGDWWVVGQRVRYLVESDRFSEAIAGARSCRAEQWWCEALEGFAQHAAGDDVAADTVYAAAVAHMPENLRCRWTDLTPLLIGALRRRFERLDCGSRSALAARVWLLAQPLLSRPGNDRRVEHYARLTMVRMLERAGSPWASPLADDLRELTLRYGWPVVWTQDLGNELHDARDISGHERRPAFHFFPNQDVALGPGDGSSPWDLSPVRPHERYAPLYAKTFETLTPDITVFRRAETTFVVVAFDLTRDTVWDEQRALSRSVVLARDDGTAPRVSTTIDSSRRGVAIGKAPWPATVVGFEVTQPGALHVGRARLAPTLRDPSLVAVSSLLVFDPWDSLPEDLGGVLLRVHGPAQVAMGGRIGLYWELYGLAPSEPIETTVHVAPLHAGLLRRVGSLLGLGKSSRETQLAWHEVAEPRDGMVHRAVVIDVSTLDPGRYRVAVTVAGRGRTVVTARELEIVRN